jgi:hypothetical protein
MVRATILRRARPRAPRSGLVALGLVVFALALTACGGGSDDPTVLHAGQLDIKLPAGFKVENGKVIAPATASGSAARSSGVSSAPASTAPSSTAANSAPTAPTTPTTAASGTTIPLDNSENPQTALFSAFGKFRACLDRAGVKFIGAPDQSNPNSPSNDPSYIKSLATCAAQSNIVAALQSAQSAQDNLTPAQIKQENKSYLKWRSCMIGRGWKIPEPTPDAQGRLFSFGTATSGSAGAQNPIQAPAGKDIFSSPDLQQCATKAQKASK